MIDMMTDAELVAACSYLAPDFMLEEGKHADPRTPKITTPTAIAKYTVGGKLYVLELIVTPDAAISGARTLAEARRSVLEGAYRTLQRVRR